MGHSQTDASKAPAPGSPKGNILIVDDAPANLRLLSQMLAEQGYHVRPVPDGPLALAAVQAELPDLILLDVRMPEMNGYEVCERLKADTETRDIPIIFISALDATQDKVRAFGAGGVDYVTKPFQVEEVLARVETHLALRSLQTRLQEANRKMERELALAGEVQASFLPRELPSIPGWQLSATLKPARQASGDFYDFISLPNARLGFVVADVTDKGAGAALYMALSCTLIRTYAVEYPVQPELVLSAVNRRILADTSASQFVTVFYGTLDPATGTLVYCNAGHCPPYHVRDENGGDVRELIGTGVPLGIFADRTWGQRVVQLDPGDALVLYTDGITEARSEQVHFFGEERLLQSVRTNLGRSAQEIQDAILTDVHRFVGDAPRSDDIALAVLIRDSKTDRRKAEFRA
ncbi:MAG: SpoIIE family protein phosphatase [Anaerolineae bacterium]|nr:MAG: SpoIIE family protein phosphatase [Anaerolineae bacterium]